MTVLAVVFVGSRRANRAGCTGEPSARVCIHLLQSGLPWRPNRNRPDRACRQRVSDLGSTERTGSRIAGGCAADGKTLLQNRVTRRQSLVEARPWARGFGERVWGATVASRSAAGAIDERAELSQCRWRPTEAGSAPKAQQRMDPARGPALCCRDPDRPFRPAGQSPSSSQVLEYTRPSQQEIAPRQLKDPEDLDLEIGDAITVDVAADDSDVVGRAGLIERLVVQLSSLAAEVPRPNQTEALVAGARGIGINISEVDFIDTVLKIGNDIANAGTDTTLGDRVEVEHVVASATGQRVATEVAGQPVVASPAAQRVRPGIAGEHIGEGRANDVLDADQPVRVAGVGEPTADGAQSDPHACCRIRIGGRVHAIAALQTVAASAPHQHVVTGAAG